MAALRSRAERTLTAALDDPSSSIKLRAAELLAGRGRDPGADAILLQDLNDVSLSARLDAAVALASEGRAEGRQALYAALGDPHRDARVQAAAALAQVGDRTGEPVLYEVLSDDRESRLGADEALARLGDAGALGTLKADLADPGGDDSSGDPPRARAAIVLGALGDADARPVLERIVADEPARIDAALALARLGDPAGIPPVERALRVPCLMVEAAQALRAAGVSPLEPTVVMLGGDLDSADVRTRVEAAAALLTLSAPPDASASGDQAPTAVARAANAEGSAP
jgi:HEAT repeat protein